ncbi:MAG TPA: hypothetical protein VNO81_09910 [Candidatus Nitrosotenuis sp.]|jgi:hypothetical protein|nr:hypothetical protein [Candidatus Nitrosotenuis sp.]
MGEPAILLYGSLANPSLHLLHRALLERGRRRVVFLEQESFPGAVGLYLPLGGGGTLLPRGAEPLDLDDVISVALDGYYVHPDQTAGLPPGDAEYAQAEMWATLIALFGQLSTRALVANHVTRRDYLGSRWGELCLLASHGLPVPRAVVTSSPREARRFWEELSGAVVYKPVSLPVAAFKALEEPDLARLDRLSLAPVHFEEAPRGSVCRLVLVGGAALPVGGEPPADMVERLRRVAGLLDLHLAEGLFRQSGGGWVCSGLRRFPSPEVLEEPAVLEAACALLEEGRR